jgi:K+-transporting ATPase ATPase B chain
MVQTDQVIPGDGDVIEGGALVNEAGLPGESAPVIREAGGDRSGVTGGTTVLSDRIVVRISAGPGESFLDKMIALVEGARRQRTPNEIALTLVLTAFTLIFMIVVVPLWPMALNAEQYMTSYLGLSDPLKSLGTDVPTLIALIVCLIPTTIGALLAAIGIAGMDRALRANIIAKSGKAVEVAGDIDTVLLDKTGTVTLGDRHAREFIPLGATTRSELMRLAALASVSDQTPEGKSIVAAYTIAEKTALNAPKDTEFVPFSAQSRMSGVNLPDGSQIRKGAPDAIVQYVRGLQGSVPAELDGVVAKIGARRSNSLGGRCERDGRRRDRARGYSETRHKRAHGATPADGTAHGHDHRRQPSHGASYRAPSGSG